MNFCLSDLVPPLRWSDAARIRGLHEPVERDGLPDAWWRALPMGHVLAVLDPDQLAELLAELALEHWYAAAIGDILPALDPTSRVTITGSSVMEASEQSAPR